MAGKELNTQLFCLKVKKTIWAGISACSATVWTVISLIILKGTKRTTTIECGLFLRVRFFFFFFVSFQSNEDAERPLNSSQTWARVPAFLFTPVSCPFNARQAAIYLYSPYRPISILPGFIVSLCCFFFSSYSSYINSIHPFLFFLVVYSSFLLLQHLSSVTERISTARS